MNAATALNPANRSELEEFNPVFGNILDFLSPWTLEVSCDIVFLASACVELFFLEADDWVAITNVLKWFVLKVSFQSVY